MASERAPALGAGQLFSKFSAFSYRNREATATRVGAETCSNALIDLDQRNNSNVVFSQLFQRAMPQSAEFAIQEMFAPDKRHQGIAALLDFATGLL